MSPEPPIQTAQSLVSPPRRKAGLHSGLDFGVTGAIATLCLPALLAFGMKLSLVLPLALLFGLTGQRFVDLIIHSRKRDVFAPSVLMAFYFMIEFGFRTVYLFSARYLSTRLGLNPYEDFLPVALWCACLGYVCFSLGFSSNWNKALEKLLPEYRPVWPRAVPGIRILALLLVGLACTVYLFKIGMAVGDFDNREFLKNPPPGLPILLQQLLYIGWVSIFVYLMLPQRIAGRRAVLPLLALSILFLFARVAMTGGKEALIQPILEALIVFHYVKKRLKLWQLAAVGLPTLVLTFGLVNFYRFVVVGKMGGTPKSLDDVISRIYSASDYLKSDKTASTEPSAFDQLMIRDAGVDALALVMKYTPNPNGFEYGRDLLTLPLAFVPRFLWKNKPIGSVSQDFETLFMGEPSYYLGFSSIHLISDFYWEFALFGVVAGMFAIGCGTRLLYRFLAPYSGDGAGVYAYAVLLPSVIHVMEKGTGAALMDVTKTIGLLVTAALAFGVVLRRAGSKKQARRPRTLSSNIVLAPATLE